jgi:hypothetical protein
MTDRSAAVQEPYWEVTQRALQSGDAPLVRRPRLTAALLQRPPFRFLHDVIAEVRREAVPCSAYTLPAPMPCLCLACHPASFAPVSCAPRRKSGNSRNCSQVRARWGR